MHPFVGEDYPNLGSSNSSCAERSQCQENTTGKSKETHKSKNPQQGSYFPEQVHILCPNAQELSEEQVIIM
jgi:hypothetical protein